MKIEIYKNNNNIFDKLDIKKSIKFLKKSKKNSSRLVFNKNNKSSYILCIRHLKSYIDHLISK